MNLVKTKITIFNQEVTRYDKLLVTFLIVMSLIGLVMLGVNTIFFHFTINGEVISPVKDYILYIKIPIFIGIIVTTFYIRKTHPHFSFICCSLSIFFIALLPLALYEQGTVMTPFHPIDHYLAYADSLVGFHLPKLVAFTHAHQKLSSILKFSYSTDLPQVLIIPALLGFADNRQGLAKFLILGLSAYVIGFAIYYFFPTNGPVSVYPHAPYFPSMQYFVAERFAQVHQGLPITAPYGGLVGFPSFHVITALLTLISSYRTKWIFYPLLILNTVLICSTILLGWHFPADVIASFIIIFILNWAYGKLFTHWLLADPATRQLFFAETKKITIRQWINFFNPWAPITKAGSLATK